MNYLCPRCRSNCCDCIDPRLKDQMVDRYLRMSQANQQAGIPPQFIGMDVAFGFAQNSSAVNSVQIIQSNTQQVTNNKLLLLRRNK